MLIAILVIIGLSLLILGHEAGHFVVAKLFGLKVDEFGFGFPPRIFAWRPKARRKGNETLRQDADGELSRTTQGETEYSFNWLPFGGFVKIAGEQGEFGSDSRIDAATEEEKKRLFYFQPAWKRSLVILAGVMINFVIGWLLISLVLMIGTPQAVVITDVQPNSPAAAVGLQAGDKVNGYTDLQTFINFVNGNRGKEIELSIERGGEELHIKATPRVKTGPNEGALGVSLVNAGLPRQGFFSALWTSLKNAAYIAWYTLIGFGTIVRGLFVEQKLVADVVGPVGIFGVAQQTGQLGLIYLVQLISLISINLAVINLIPFPALDGGRFFMILIEKLKGSPISKKTEALANGVSFAFLIALMVIITAHDIARWL